MQLTDRLLSEILTILFCIVAPVGISIVAAILGTRSRLRLARRIGRLRSAGFYASSFGSPIARKLRLMFAIELLSISGVGLITFLALLRPSLLPPRVILAVLAVLGMAAVGVGILLHRAVTRPTPNGSKRE